MSKDFADPPTAKPGKADAAGWWNWKPQKAALEYLWRTGELVIARRINFNKVYDLSERVIPEVLRAAAISEQEHIAWACTSALDRLGTATPREIAAFWNAITIQEARAWCTAAAREGRIIPVTIDGSVSPGPRPRSGPSNGDVSKQTLHHAFATADYPMRLARALQPPAGVRLLSPFDPLIRDRQRTQRLFGFEYRFEAFTPAAKRKYGYYTLPILEGDRLIGRADPALDRAEGKLDIRIYWEPGIKATRPRIAALREAVAAYARFNNAENFTISR